MTNNEQSVFADMATMLERIHAMLENGEDINGTRGLYDDIGELLQRALSMAQED